MCGIYLITNIVTKKVYVGQSIDIQRRWAEHQARAFNNNNNCYDKPLYRSMRKYGLDKFVLSVLCECESNQLNELEAYYITKLDCIVPNGYNVQSPAEICAPVYGVRKCQQCGKTISYATVHNLCRECYMKSTRRVVRPSAEELKQLLYQYNFVTVGKMFGVTDNAIRKWCKSYGLPTHSKDYK